MEFSFTPEQEQLRHDLRIYFDKLMTPELRSALRFGYSKVSATDAYREVIRRLGEDGWLGIGWPKDIGGQGWSAIEQSIFNEEAQRADVPTPLLTINSVGPMIARFGTEEQKRTLLPGILRGEIHFAIGYSEAEAGSDLASLRTRAVRDGDAYVINGQKLWTGLMEAADYIWLAARTNPDEARHRGISIFIVPRHAPGISSSRIRTLGDNSVAAVAYDDVRVSADSCIGGEGNGWAIMTGQLNTERVALAPSASHERTLEQVVSWAAERIMPAGHRLLDEPHVRRALAQITAEVEFLKLLNWKLASSSEHNTAGPGEASAAKVFSSDFSGRALNLLVDIVGLEAFIAADAPGALLDGSWQRRVEGNPVGSIAGGASEIQRDLIAQLQLGLPRSR